MVEPAAAPVAGAGPANRRPRDRAATASVVLVVLGLLLLAAYRFTASDERHSFADGATAPSSFALTAGEEYSIGIPGGVTKARALLPDPTAIACTVTPVGGGASSQVSVAAESDTSKAINQIGRFVAPVTGRVAVRCTGLPAVFVDDADDAGFDWSGLCVLLASACLVIGLPLLFSVARRHFMADQEPYPTA